MKIGLGTVQFGLDYGVANRAGRPAESEGRAVCDAAWKAGVRVFDTAPGYGESEARLGAWLEDRSDVRIVTKTDAEAETAVDSVTRSLDGSLQRLGRDAVYGMLEHRAQRWLGEQGDAHHRALRAERDAGRVAKIGVSVYDPATLEALLERFEFDLVQVPVSVFDQRMLRSGLLARLRARGVEVHARSVLLQGVVGMRPEALPDALESLRPSLERLRALAADLERSPVSLALAYACALEEVDVVLCGVQDRAQWEEVEAAATQGLAASVLEALASLAIADPDCVDPSRWSAR